MNIPKQTFLRPAVLVGFLILLSTSLAVSPAYAATIQFTGTIGAIELDNGSSAYSGLTVGDTFSGRITYGIDAVDASYIVFEEPTVALYGFADAPYGGFFTSGSTITAGTYSSTEIGDNNEMREEAVFINNLYGAGSTTDVTIADTWAVEGSNDGFNETQPDEFQFFGVTLYSLDTSLYSGFDIQSVPPVLTDSDFAIFFFGQTDEDEEEIFVATGILTSITVIPDPPLGCGALLTTDTTLSADMVCPGTALFLSRAGSNNVILDCAGFSITTTGRGSPGVSAFDVTGVEIKNCNIDNMGVSGRGIAMSDVSNSEISDNIITTDKTFAAGITMNQSTSNVIDGNTISTTGISSRGLNIQNQSSGNVVSGNSILSALSNGVRIRAGSDSNTLSNNSIESGASNAVRIESASNNILDGNTFISPLSFVRIQNLSIQNGGLSVDDAGNIFAIENNFGSSGGSAGAVATLIQVDPNTGDVISAVRLSTSIGGPPLGFGFDSLEIMPSPDGRFLATRGGSNSSWYEIDPATGVVSLLTPIANVGNFNGLQVLNASTLLATTNSGDLLSIDLDTNTGTLIGQDQDGDGWTDLAMHPTSSRLFTLSRWFYEPSGTSHLFEIDPATGLVIQEIGDTGGTFMSDIDFSTDGTLYANNGLYTINITTGLGTYIGGFGPDPFEPISENNVLTNQTFTATTTASSVQFQEPIDLPPSLLLTLDEEAIQIGENSIFVDSAQFPFLDVPARIVFENLGGSARVVLVDLEDDGTFEPCDPTQCTIVSFVDGTLIFDVTGFTTYTSEAVGDLTLESAVLVVLAEIDALLVDPGVSGKAVKKLKKSNKKLVKALDKLEKGDVKKAFKEISKAVKELLKAGKEGVDVSDSIDLLVESSRTEAQDAIDMAIADGGKPKDIEKAERELVKAQKELDKGKPDKAIDHYGHAWEKAQKAVK